MDGAKVQGSTAEGLLRALKRRGIDYVLANAGTDFAPIIEGLVRLGGRPANAVAGFTPGVRREIWIYLLVALIIVSVMDRENPVLRSFKIADGLVTPESVEIS